MDSICLTNILLKTVYFTVVSLPAADNANTMKERVITHKGYSEEKKDATLLSSLNLAITFLS